MTTDAPVQTRAALIGTAETWNQAPFDDPSIRIVTLNDGYALGMPRSDEHYDIHPIDQMWFRPAHKRVFQKGEIPDGVFVRPEGHLQWLERKAKTSPIWLHSAPPQDWPANAQRFPWEQVQPLLKARPDQDAYAMSSPAWILGHLILRGFTEIQIFGIHLATQHEYIKQRPGFEWLIGKAESRGVKIVLPEACPLLKGSHVYAVEPEPPPPDANARARHAAANKEFQAIATSLLHWPAWKPRKPQLDKLLRLKGVMRDANMEARHALTMKEQRT